MEIEITAPSFDYFTAFQRNLGFVSKAEQEKLRVSRVAIAGLGGTGGAQVHALARLGIGHFNLADLDTFELVNFNRQIGATMQTIGRRKTEVMAELAHSINPEADVRLFEKRYLSGEYRQFSCRCGCHRRFAGFLLLRGTLFALP